ncbi:MAG TPA: transglycosylase family protein [Capillimicrobium sp.]|nr:transglycosylase family protein [Capillimicrobium sp.]
MRTSRTLALAGAATAALAAAPAAALADGPDVGDPSVLDAALAGDDTIAETMRGHTRARAHRRLLRELRRHDRRPSGAVAGLTTRELRARTRELRAERRAEARAAQAAEEAAAAAPTGVLAAIAQCESGGDPTAIGGGGLYRGLYQFDLQTWQSVGGTGDPAAASVAEQTKRAQILYERAGTSPWPVCGG